MAFPGRGPSTSPARAVAILYVATTTCNWQLASDDKLDWTLIDTYTIQLKLQVAKYCNESQTGHVAIYNILQVISQLYKHNSVHTYWELHAMVLILITLSNLQ